MHASAEFGAAKVPHENYRGFLANLHGNPAIRRFEFHDSGEPLRPRTRLPVVDGATW